MCICVYVYILIEWAALPRNVSTPMPFERQFVVGSSIHAMNRPSEYVISTLDDSVPHSCQRRFVTGDPQSTQLGWQGAESPRSIGYS